LVGTASYASLKFFSLSFKKITCLLCPWSSMTENSMNSSKVIELMAKKLGKSASIEELEELGRLVSENPSYSLLEEIVGSLKGNPEHFERNIPENELVDRGWGRLAGRLKEVVRMEERRPRIWRRVAAAVVIVVVG